MANFKRASAYASDEVDISADDMWAMLRDWGAAMKWAATGPDAPVELTDTKLKNGHSVDVLPCTRICYFTPESGLPPVLETLIHADPEARRIYYNAESVVAGGMRNYLATTTVEDIGSSRARVTCQSMFDVPDDADPEPIRGFLEAVYNQSVIKGIEQAVKREKAALFDA